MLSGGACCEERLSTCCVIAEPINLALPMLMTWWRPVSLMLVALLQVLQAHWIRPHSSASDRASHTRNIGLRAYFRLLHAVQCNASLVH